MKLIPRGKHISCFKFGDKLKRLIPVYKSGGLVDDSYDGKYSYIILDGIDDECIFFRTFILDDDLKWRELIMTCKADIKIWGDNWVKM